MEVRMSGPSSKASCANVALEGSYAGMSDKMPVQMLFPHEGFRTTEVRTKIW